MTRLSVIVPVYNVEDYLDECLSSLAAQEPCDFEAVCVDDGSTDSSPEILSKWAARVPWIRLVTKPNGGLSSARNAGMAAAQGDYVCFLDSDDLLAPQACRRIVEALDESQADVLVYGGTTVPPEVTTPWLEQTLSPRDLTFEAPGDELLFGKDTRPFAWRVALSRSFARDAGIRFDESMPYGEDQPFLFDVYLRSHRTRLVPDRLYGYRVMRSGSLMNDARRDLHEMLLEHVRIAEACACVFERAEALGPHARRLIEWMLELVANDALLLPTKESTDVMGQLGQVIARRWDDREVRRLGLHPSELAVVEAATSGMHMSAMRRTVLFSSLHRHLYGRKSTLFTLLGANRGLR